MSIRRALIPAVAVTLAALTLACGAGGTNKPAGPQSEAAPAAAVTDPPATTANPPTVAATSEAAPAGPVTAFADGTYEVGNGAGQVAPGRYKTTADEHCYWERLRGLSGSFGDIIANGNLDAGAPGIVAIAKTDVAFKTTGGCVWRKS